MRDGLDGGAATYRIVYDEAVLRAAVRAYVRRRFFAEQRGLWAAEAVVLASFVGLLVAGDRSWVTGVLGTVAALPPLLVLGGWLAHLRHGLGRLRRMPDRAAEVAFRDDGLGFRSGLGSAHLPWSGITEVWERPGFRMIFTAPNQFSTLPTAGIAPGHLAMLRARAGPPAGPPQPRA